MDPGSWAIIGICAGVMTVGSFIGSSLSNFWFSPSTKQSIETQSQIKNDIRVLSNEVHGIGIMEVIIISIIICVVMSILTIFVTAWLMKKCKSKPTNAINEIPLQNV